MTRVREVDAHDAAGLDQVRALFRQFAEEYAPLVAEVFVVQGFTAEVAGLPGRYGPPSGCLLLAEVDGEPAGCVALRDLGDGIAEMKRLYVAPAGRGRGVGRTLVAAILDRARDLGYGRMVLDTLREMPEAIALYEAFGFTPTEPYWGHPADHAVFLGRPI